MAPQRATTPPRRPVMDGKTLPPPSTPAPGNRGGNSDGNGDSNGGNPSGMSSGESSDNVIMGSSHASVPPSPGLLVLVPDSAASDSSGRRTRSFRRRDRRHRMLTGAGVKKSQPKKSLDLAAKLLEAALEKKAVELEKAPEQPFRFMDLPGEIRNMIYAHTYDNAKQALLVHRPRIASLRLRTRLDRARPLASDLIEKEQDDELATFDTIRRTNKVKPKIDWSRETNRPFVGLTQVCKQIRQEFRPIYLAKQEIGMDITEIIAYLDIFYPGASETIAALPVPGTRTVDAPFTGNLTIAIGDKPTAAERVAEGVEVFPLLNTWANSLKIEAGFGRYQKARYVPETDGEAKDLYRLFGRRVLFNRTCSPMNHLWRAILRSQALASVRVHRSPAPRLVQVPNTARRIAAGHPPLITRMMVRGYIHIIFKKAHAEPWMTKFESDVPANSDWLAARGFGGMEHFEVKVGVEQ